MHALLILSFMHIGINLVSILGLPYGSADLKIKETTMTCPVINSHMLGSLFRPAGFALTHKGPEQALLRDSG